MDCLLSFEEECEFISNSKRQLEIRIEILISNYKIQRYKHTGFRISSYKI